MFFDSWITSLLTHVRFVRRTAGCVCEMLKCLALIQLIAVLLHVYNLINSVI